MATNAANPDQSDEFWRDDAVAMQRAEALREQERRTGLRMPPASAASMSARPERPSFEAIGSNHGERSALWWVGVITAGIVIGSVVCGVIGYAAGWFVFDRMLTNQEADEMPLRPL